MGKIIIALALALAAHADFAKADTTYTNQYGTPITVVESSATLIAIGYSRVDGEWIEQNVFDCTKGYGNIELWNTGRVAGVPNKTFLAKNQWSKKGTTVTDKIATLICDFAINKATK
jgi:hypothetical protein